MTRSPRQLEFVIRTWGGRRRGAGRKPGPGRRRVPHRRRPLHDSHCPVHVTLRAAACLPSLRCDRLFAPITVALATASRDGFRLLHFSLQADHLHLLVEADAPMRLARGMQALAIRVARAVNRALRRSGKVWVDRYHARELPTPREIRNALVYVLNNWRKHIPGARGLDPRSSARWFEGWKERLRQDVPPSPVATARTWLARVGWRRHGLLEIDEAPRKANRGPGAKRKTNGSFPKVALRAAHDPLG